MSTAQSQLPNVCPLCAFNVTDRSRSSTAGLTRFQCDRCGDFIISDELMEILTPELRYKLSAVSRLPGGVRPSRLLADNAQSLINALPRLSIRERLDQLLQFIAEKSDQIGAVSQFSLSNDYPLLVLKNSRELEPLMDALERRGFINRGSTGTIVTVRGLEHLDTTISEGRTSRNVFVAMWFDRTVNELYTEAIHPAIRECGYEPTRIDRREHVNRIDDEIVAQIKSSRFMVADFTGQRHGVYFESGMMMGLGRNVIWMCKRQEIADGALHFDVRQYNFIDWESIDDAKTRLKNRIRALEGQGPGGPPA